MHTELYCESLANLDPVQAVRAIHQAWLQLSAARREPRPESSLDHAPALHTLALCLKAAGHPGFQEVIK